MQAIFNPGKNNLYPPTLILDGGEIEIVKETSASLGGYGIKERIN